VTCDRRIEYLTTVYFTKDSQFPKLKSIAQQQLTTLNAQGTYHTYIGVGFLHSNHQFLPPSPDFKTYITQLSFLDCTIMSISPLGVHILSSSLPPIILNLIKEYPQANPVQIDLNIPTSSYVVEVDEDNVPSQGVMDVDSSEDYDERARGF
jgi:hypothetical protein